MAKVEPLGKEMDLVKKSFADVFAGKALAWQLGGTMVAALLFGAILAISAQGFVGVLLSALAFIIGYVILSATGCLVARVIDQKGEAEAGVAPLHFLIDNIGAALLLPLVVAAGSFVVCLVLYLYFLLWRTSVGQGIAVVFLPVFFVIALVLILKVFAFLFVGPAMIVKEGLSFSQCLSRLYHLGMRRRTESSKLFGTGLVMTVGALIPITVVLFSALALLYVIWRSANGDIIAAQMATQMQQLLQGQLPAQQEGVHIINGFTHFVLVVYFLGILVAPLLTIPLAMMNAITLNCYDDVVSEVDDVDDEEGEAPAAGEEPDVVVEGDSAEADETKAE
jgi:hypothetical protein